MQGLHLAEFDGDRVRLPGDIADRVPLKGSEQVNCWLMVVSPGRFRLMLRGERRDAKGDLARVLDEIEKVEQPGEVLAYTESDAKAALVGRMIPASASPPGPGWRLNIPRIARAVSPGGREAKFVFLAGASGYVDVWFPEAWRQAQTVPLPELLP